jgi:glycosyltransferase involved in cell wall biosynthesis
MKHLGIVLPYPTRQVVPMVPLSAAMIGWGTKVVYWTETPGFRKGEGWHAPEGSVKLGRGLLGGSMASNWLTACEAYFFLGFSSPFPGMPFLLLRALISRRPVLVLSEGLRDHQFGLERRLLMKMLSLFGNGRLLAIGTGAVDDFLRLGLRWPAYEVGYGEESLPIVGKEKKEDVFRLVAVGQLIPRKRISRIIDWLASGNWNRPILLRVCGEGPERAALEQQSAQLGRLDLRFEFTGHLDKLSLAREFALADAFVHLPDYEGWGMVVQQAAEAGLPLIVSPEVRSGRGVLVMEGENGFVIENAASFSDAIRKLAADQRLQEAMGNRSRVISREWGLEAGSRRIASILREMMCDSSGNEFT